jgi:hypothetical protein
MRHIAISFALVLSAAAPAGAQSVDVVKWMAGCWELRTPTRIVEEYWMPPRGGTMLGMGRTVVRDSMIEFESTLIRQRGGRLVYAANPSGQAPATFTAIVANGDSVVFELPEHDFPQRIGYTRRGADSLLAWIEGTRGGAMRRIPFTYARVACPTH